MDFKRNGNGTKTEEKREAPPFALHHDAWGHLVLTDAEGREHVGVEPVRAFPITDPGHGIALCDSHGKELVWIDDLTTLPAPLRQMLEDDLAQRQFLPVLRRVISVSSHVEPSEWDVETDRGRTRFPLKSDEDVFRLADHRALVIDAHGIRYLIPDVRALDNQSRRILELYL